MLLSLNKYLTKSFGSPWVTHRFSQNFFLRALRVSSVRFVSKKKVTEYTKIFTENTEILQNDVLWPFVFLCDLRVSSVRVVSKKGHGVHEDFHGEHGDSSK